MKKVFPAIAVLCATFLLGACATTTGGSVASSPAQIAAALCPATNTALTLITAFNTAEASVLPVAAAANTTINTTVKPIVNDVCAVGATITSTNIQTLISQGVPAIAGIVATLPLPPATQAAIQGGFAAAELGVGLVNLYENSLGTAQKALMAVKAPTGA